MVIRITYPNHGHSCDFLCFLLMNYEFEKRNSNSFSLIDAHQYSALSGFIEGGGSRVIVNRCNYTLKFDDICFAVLQELFMV